MLLGAVPPCRVRFQTGYSNRAIRHATVSGKKCIVCTTSEFLTLSTMKRIFKILLYFVRFTELNNREGMEIDSYSEHKENKLQGLTFVARTFVCISLQHWNLA